MQYAPPIAGDWHEEPSPSLSRQQKYWLYRPGALTAGLRRLGTVELRVSAEYSTGLTEAEAWMLARPVHSPIWVREIMMSIDGTDSVFARSFTPLLASHSWWQGMRRLRTRPLADMLYHDPQIIRSPFRACRLRPQNPLYATAGRIMGSERPPAREILARCSTFSRHGEPLLVAEGFLPAFWGIAARSAFSQSLPLRSI